MKKIQKYEHSSNKKIPSSTSENFLFLFIYPFIYLRMCSLNNCSVSKYSHDLSKLVVYLAIQLVIWYRSQENKEAII